MRRFLEQVRIDAYGKLRDVSLGPLGPGLNVVFGPNEAGKSTVASFIGGVLFGWDEGHAARAAYHPPEGGRAGALVFADRETGVRSELSRAEGAGSAGGRPDLEDPGALGGGSGAPGGGQAAPEGGPDAFQGDPDIVADIDLGTYRAMFSLAADDLRSLEGASDVAERMLTAGSGSEASPFGAYAEVERRIARRTSRAGDPDESVEVIGEQLEAARERMRDAGAAADLYKQESRELRDLVEARALAAARLDEADETLEGLRGAKARMEAVDAQAEGRVAELAALEAEARELAAEGPGAQAADARLMALDATGDRLLRDRLDDLSDDLEKAARAVESAEADSAASSAAYEALVEVGEGRGGEAKGLAGKRAQAFVSVALPLVFVLVGVLVFAHARRIHSLALTALGAALVVLAFFLAAAALVVLFRPDRGAEALEARRNDAQWVMLQDRKKLDAALEARRRIEAGIAEVLDAAGLSAAGGSIRQARILLDDAHDARARDASLRQRAASLDLRAKAARSALEALGSDRLEAVRAAGLPDDCALERVDAEIARTADRRAAIASAFDDMGKRSGELEQRLAQARCDTSFAEAKFAYHRLKSQMRESKGDLVTLLLAERMLERGIAAWESSRQPEVYERAGRLFRAMTGGAWDRIAMTADGRLAAVAPDGSERDVAQLSLGTCQQLYLSLRVAMLVQASSVGRSIPVVADDILVNFDAGRRAATARVIAELARERQVIVFTCHRETVRALRDADPGLSYMEL